MSLSVCVLYVFAYFVIYVFDEKPQKLILEKKCLDSVEHIDFNSTVAFLELSAANHARLKPSARISAAEMIDEVTAEDDDDDQFRHPRR